MIIDEASYEWRVSRGGYQWVTDPDDGERELIPQSLTADALIYKPSEKRKIFYRLLTTELSESGIVGFANTYGTLGIRNPKRATADPRSIDAASWLAEPYSRWIQEIERLNFAFDCWRAIRNEDTDLRKRVEACIRSNGPGTVPWMAKDGAVAGTNEVFDTVRIALMELIELGLRERTTGVLDYRNLSLTFEPSSLVAAIWLQFARAVDSKKWHDCLHCGEPFKYRRSTAKFCSKSHEVIFNRNKREGTKS